MHDLIDHGHLTTRDLLRIGSIWIDVKLVLQRELIVGKPLHPPRITIDEREPPISTSSSDYPPAFRASSTR